MLLYATVAVAQPAGEPTPPGPQEPTPPGDAPPPADTSNGQIVVTDPNAPSEGGAVYVPPSQRAYGPLDQEGWPRGFSMEDLRELPACGPSGIPEDGGEGAPIRCRPVLETVSPAWMMGFDYTTGATFGGVPTAGGAHGFGVDLHFALSRHFQIGARYEFLGISVPRVPGEGSHAALSQHVLGSARLRLWTDEVGRNAWTLGAGGGLAIRGDVLGGVAPMLRASIARELGLFYKRHAALFAIELAYEHTLADPELRAILVSLRTGAEINVITPRNLGTPMKQSSHIMSLHMLLSAWWGLGMSFGVPLVGPLRWETTGDFLTNVTEHMPKFRAYEGAQWSARTGLRLGVGPMYALGQGGMSWYAHDPSGDLHRVLHGELGFDINLVTLGAWFRWDLDDSFDSAGIVLSFVFGGGRWGARIPPLRLWQTHVPSYGGGSVDVDANVNVDVNVSVEPIVIEVPLGVSVFGVGVRIDINKLPLAKLKSAGFVQIELSGPASELSAFRAQLSGTLDSRGIRVDGWSSVETGAHVVRAKFTIWPPGARPPQ